MSDYWDEDDEPIVRESVEWHRSRRARPCNACHGVIRAGDRYVRDAKLWGGRWHVTARCERCETIYGHLNDRIHREGEPEEFCNERLNCGHDYRERWGEDPPPEIAALAFWLPGEPVG